MKKNNDHQTGIPMYIIQSLTRCMLPDIISYYESQEGKEYFEKWKAEQEKKEKK